VKRAVIMSDGKMVTAADLDLLSAGEDRDDVINLKAAREMADRRAIRRAIERSQGNISHAARALGVSRPTLYELMKQYGIKD
jgi:two-component system NtrC family response regulator